MESNEEQQMMQMAASYMYLRTIVEVCLRGQQRDNVQQWKEGDLKAMLLFGVFFE